jgi:hypothetical protein
MFVVHWLQSALDALSAMWVQADSDLRKAITDASHRVELILRNDPLDEGESRYGTSRIMFVPPLAVTFQIESDGISVTILHVCLFRKREK